MIDLEKCKEEFIKYTEQFDLENEGIKRKQEHSLRVMEESKKVAEALNLDEEKVEVAELIGLLHDIGRFEQYKMNNTYLNEMLLDHAKLGVKVLIKDDYIKKYIDDKHYIDIILKAIINRQVIVPYNTFSPLRWTILAKIKKITISTPKIIISK